MARFQVVNCEGCGEPIQVPVGASEDGHHCESCIYDKEHEDFLAQWRAWCD